MKERNIVGIIVALLAFLAVLASGNTDIIFVSVSVGSFALCIAYAEGCEKL